jgi:hypothetical protein
MVSKIISTFHSLWEEKEKKNKRPFMVKDVFYFTKGGIVKSGHEGVQTNWVCENSVGWELGLRPKFLHLSLTYDFSETEIRRFVPGELLEKADSKWLKTTKRTSRELSYRIIPGPFIPAPVMNNLWKALKEATGIKEADLLPAHPTWLYEEGLGVNFCVRRLGTPSFADVLGKRRDIFYRAGKDLWKVPLFVKRNVRVLVIETESGDDDGNMWVRSQKNFMYLVRGIVKLNGNPLLLKGRVVGIPTLPGGKPWPEGDYDIVTSGHNIKWGTVAPGSVIKMDVQFVLNELHLDEEPEVEEKRKLTILTSLLAKAEPEYKNWLNHSFRKNAMNVAKFMNGYTKCQFNDLERALSKEPESIIALDQALKARLGFLSEEQLAEVENKQLRKLRSAKIPGQWLAAIAQSQVPVGKIWLSVHDKVDMFNTEVTVIRYPVTGYQSFLTLEVDWREDLPKGLSVINSQDAKYLALDGDDHILVTKPFSAFRGGEPVMSERSNATKLELSSLSFIELYTSGGNAQEIIGYCFNAMASALGFSQICEEKGNKEKAKEMKSLAERLGMLLDMLAQAIKKPYFLDLEAINLASAIQGAAAKNPLAAVCLSRNLDTACEALWGVKVPKIKPAKVFTGGLAKIPEDVIKLMSEGLKRAAAAKNGHQQYKVLLSLNSSLLKWVKNHPDLEMAAMVYYTVAVYLHRKEAYHQMISLMDGVLLYLGRTLCEQRYIPLFQSQ